MSRPLKIAICALYGVLLGAVIWGMFYTRDTLAPELATGEGRAAWNKWRDDVAEQESGPVARRNPSSSEPPLVVLMRDHFAVCLAGAILFSSLLFAVLVILIRGALTPNHVSRNRDPNRPAHTN